MSHDPERVNALERLPRRRQPERDLWPGIHARLAPRRSRYPAMQLALAASVVAGLAAMFALGLRDAAVPGSPVTVAAAPAFLTDDSRAIVEANLSLTQQAEREVRQALRQNPDSKSLRSLLASAEHRQRALRAML